MADVVLAGYKWTREEWFELDPITRGELLALTRKKVTHSKSPEPKPELLQAAV